MLGQSSAGNCKSIGGIESFYPDTAIGEAIAGTRRKGLSSKSQKANCFPAFTLLSNSLSSNNYLVAVPLFFLSIIVSYLVARASGKREEMKALSESLQLAISTS